VVTIGYGAFLGRQVKEKFTLLVVEPWQAIEFLDLLIHQDLEPLFV
jgi:hypothetical protein